MHVGLAPTDQLPPGHRIARYEVIQHIGDGGMATIYLARAEGPGGFSKPCALKLLRPDYASRSDVADLLLHEARVAAHLNHPNIVQVFDFGRSDDAHYMVMEWVDGLTLSRLLGRLARLDRTLPIELAAFVGGQVAEALAYLRSGVVLDEGPVSLVHRDVSPSNVLVSNLGAVKLTDFGIVKVLETPAMTQVGVVKGKYAYMAPEQLRGEPVDHRSDVFSLGVVLFEALTCRRLFYRKTLAATVAAVHSARVCPPSSVNPAVPPELDAVVLRALAKRPEDRYPDAGLVAAALEEFVSMGSRPALSALVQEVALLDDLPTRGEESSGRSAPPAMLTSPAALPPLSSDPLDLNGPATQILDEIEDVALEPGERYREEPSSIRRRTRTFEGQHGTSEQSAPVPARTPAAALTSPRSLLPAAVVGMTIAAIVAFWWAVLTAPLG